jgi:hypothetical protein
VASAFTSSLGTAHECNTSAVTMIRMNEFIGDVMICF